MSVCVHAHSTVCACECARARACVKVREHVHSSLLYGFYRWNLVYQVWQQVALPSEPSPLPIREKAIILFTRLVTFPALSLG